jgi:hypothetical protein
MPEQSEQEKELIRTKPSEALDEEAAKQLVSKCEASLQLVVQGANEPACEWGLDFSQGPTMKLPHIAKGMSLAKVLGLRARIELQNREFEKAMDDLLTLMHFSRHLSEPRLLIGYLVQISVDAIAVDMALRHLQEFDTASLRKSSEEIAALPSSYSLSDIMPQEAKLFGDYLREKLVTAMAPDPENGTDDDTTRSVIKTLRIFPILSFYMIEKYERKSQEISDLLKLPYHEGRQKLQATETDISSHKFTDLLSALALPAVCGVKATEARSERAWEILRTAIAAQMRDPTSVREALVKLHDPYDNTPLEWKDVPGGIQVKFKAARDKKSLTLMVELEKTGRSR